MNKILIAVSLMFIMSVANAGLLDSVMTSNFKTKNTTSEYKIDVYGYDVRVYEWKPTDNPNYRCVFVAGSSNSSGTACYPAK